MLDRLEGALKWICLALAILLVAKLAQRFVRMDPLGNAAIPPLPTLTVAAPPTNAVPTNAPPTNALQTNAPASTNKIDAPKPGSTNTNAVVKARRPRRGGSGMPGMFGPGMGGPGGGLTLPTAIQARVDRIKESEILGPFMRPPPMALMGIADDEVFLRGPDGQTGLVKEGGDLGAVKVLRIGINRVLVEENGEKKELTLFNGFGSESLLPKDVETSTNAPATNAPPAPNKKEHQ
jgi:hypothetical protein